MQQLYLMSRRLKRLVMMVIDFFTIIVAIWLALAIRLGEVWPQEWVVKSWLLFLILPPLGIILYGLLGIYHSLIRVMGRRGFSLIVFGALLLTLSMLVLSIYPGSFIKDSASFPRSMPFIFLMLLISGIIGSRVFIQWLHMFLKDQSTNLIPVLIYGSGATGTYLSNSLRASTENRLVAFIDDDPKLVGTVVNGYRVYGKKDVSKLTQKYSIKRVLLAVPSASRRQRAKIISEFEKFDLEMLTIPSMHELVSGQATVDQLYEPKATEILTRDAVEFIGNGASDMISGKCVLVTGAGGSIGSELSRQIFSSNPKTLILFENSELALYLIERELRENEQLASLNVEIYAILGSVGDENRLTDIIMKHRPSIIFHAAAYKHVPLVEANALEGIRNNIFGTKTVAETAARLGVKSFVMISTDKAVRPTNVMGATKRVAELVCQDLQLRYPDTTFSMVRFGNVLASSGSVIPVFKKQIKGGGPVTVTHPEITRYFMTIPEASQLVIQASILAAGGEVFVLDMGEPVKIADMARNMIILSGLQVMDKQNPEGDIEIVYTGLRPGEKLFEELLIDANATPTAHTKIMKAQENCLSTSKLNKAMKELKKAIEQNNTKMAKVVLFSVVEGYSGGK